MKTAAVTGAGSGIGAAIAEALAKDGFNVSVLDRDEQASRSTCELIESAGGSAEFHACDVSDLASVEKAFTALKSIDVLVNNAGIASIGNVAATSPEEFDRIYSVNVKGVYHCLHVAVPKMVAAGGGAIVNLSSIAANLGIDERFAYSMSKGAVSAMTMSVAKDYIGQGIRCNCLCPARVQTPFVDGYLEKNYPEDERPAVFEALSAYQPIGRMAQPGEIADLVAFLCSDKAAFITGSSFDIDGGVTRLR